MLLPTIRRTSLVNRGWYLQLLQLVQAMVLAAILITCQFLPKCLQFQHPVFVVFLATLAVAVTCALGFLGSRGRSAEPRPEMEEVQ